MAKTDMRTTCPAESVLADYLSGTLTRDERERIESHIATCDECLAKIVSGYESVESFKKESRGKTGKDNIMKRINWYLVGAVIAFLLSFIFPRYFLQFLVATLILGIKWVVDSKSAKMLIMIYEAWRSGGEKEASKILQDIGSRINRRF